MEEKLELDKSSPHIPLQPMVFIYGNPLEKTKIQRLLNGSCIEIGEAPGQSKFQQERAFLTKSLSAVAIVYISGKNSIPLGILSADPYQIHSPMVFYIENTTLARTVCQNLVDFFRHTHPQVNKPLSKKPQGFYLDKAICAVLVEHGDMKKQLITAINNIHRIHQAEAAEKEPSHSNQEKRHYRGDFFNPCMFSPVLKASPRPESVGHTWGLNCFVMK